LVFRGLGALGLDPRNAPIEVMIAAWQWNITFGPIDQRPGLRTKVVSWRRVSTESLIPQAKVSGQYLNGVLGKLEAAHSGYDEGIKLDSAGHVCEATGQNIFLVRNNVLITPTLAGGALEGITRDSVMQIASDLNYQVVERVVAREELYSADELFLTNTASELMPIRAVDNRTVGDGSVGPITVQLAHQLDDAFHGKSERYSKWLEYPKNSA
jgi:branched-chain amino acid aminotransferase